MRDTKNGAISAGYDQEEAYFHKQNRELIEEMKKNKGSDLRLIQGGKSESAKAEPVALLPAGKGTGIATRPGKVKSKKAA